MHAQSALSLLSIDCAILRIQGYARHKASSQYGYAGYSVWTNSSFKAPLISSAIACILGNTLYCIGYDTKWLSVLMAARLLTGLGERHSVSSSSSRPSSSTL